MQLHTGETLEHRELFEYYYCLPAQERSYKAVSEHFADRKIANIPVTEARVKRWAGQFHWADMIRARDEEIARRVEESVVGQIADAKTELIAKTNKLIETWFKEKMSDIASAQLTVANIPARDMLAFMKFALEMQENDSKDPAKDASQEQSKIAALSELSADELRRLIEGDKPSGPN